jgi:hypothetical protein
LIKDRKKTPNRSEETNTNKKNKKGIESLFGTTSRVFGERFIQRTSEYDSSVKSNNYDDDDSDIDVDQENIPLAEICDELSTLVNYFQPSKFTSFHESKKKACYYRMHSLSETDAFNNFKDYYADAIKYFQSF